MEPIATRSDSRHRLLDASPSEVFFAMSDPARVARWWGPAGVANTIHHFEFKPGGRWLLTMHGPDGKDYPNESRFTRIVTDRVFEIEHLNGHHFFLRVGDGAGRHEGDMAADFRYYSALRADRGVCGFSQRAESRPLGCRGSARRERRLARGAPCRKKRLHRR